MRVKLDHKPGKAEIVARMDKHEATSMIEALNMLATCNYPEPMQRKLRTLANDLQKGVEAYPEATA